MTAWESQQRRRLLHRKRLLSLQVILLLTAAVSIGFYTKCSVNIVDSDEQKICEQPLPEPNPEKHIKRYGLYYITAEELRSLGVCDSAVNAFLSLKNNYIMKGSTTADTLKLLNTNNAVTLLASHLQAKNKPKAHSKPSFKPELPKRGSLQPKTDFNSRLSQPATSFAKVNINTADSAELCSVKGIGPWRARYIITKRGWLGGYISIEQLKEVKSIDSAAFNQIKDQVTAEGNVKRIHLDSLSPRTRHPYLNATARRAIIDAYVKSKSASQTISRQEIRNILLMAEADTMFLNYLQIE